MKFKEICDYVRWDFKNLTGFFQDFDMYCFSAIADFIGLKQKFQALKVVLALKIYSDK